MLLAYPVEELCRCNDEAPSRRKSNGKREIERGEEGERNDEKNRNGVYVERSEIERNYKSGKSVINGAHTHRAQNLMLIINWGK